MDKSKRIYHWEMKQPIPTYLSSVAIAPYEEIAFEHAGIPVTLVCKSEDTAKMKASFVHLRECIDAFQTAYGPHNFDRIGFNAVPFNGGAMEHATNIAYPLFGVDGTLAMETLYAHELAHHWWGNSVTCADAEDMWLNEGWASFSESLFLEFVYGKDRYKEYTRENHRDVLHYAHLRDGQALPVSGIGHAHTYGSHVYNKGADMVHTLRGWMGDSAFFAACSSFISSSKFQSITTEMMQDHFQAFTQIDLTPFFQEWIKKPGSPNYDILGFSATSNGDSYTTKIRIRQRLRLTTSYYTKVPLDITFMNANMEAHTAQILMDGADETFLIETPFIPTFAALDMQEKLSDAISDEHRILKDTGSFTLSAAMMNIHVASIQDSALIRVEHHWVAPDGYYHTSQLPVLTKERYWKIDGVGLERVQFNATLEYNGRLSGTNYAAGYLDPELLRNEPEDKLVLMYRPHATANWVECSDYSVQPGTTIYDRKGEILIKNAKAGEYALAIQDQKLLSEHPVDENSLDAFTISPNPADQELRVRWDKKQQATLEVLDRSGRLVYQETVKAKKATIPLDTLARGVYYIGVILDGKPYHPKAFIVRGH